MICSANLRNNNYDCCATNVNVWLIIKVLYLFYRYIYEKVL